MGTAADLGMLCSSTLAEDQGVFESQDELRCATIELSSDHI